MSGHSCDPIKPLFANSSAQKDVAGEPPLANPCSGSTVGAEAALKCALGERMISKLLYLGRLRASLTSPATALQSRGPDTLAVLPTAPQGL